MSKNQDTLANLLKTQDIGARSSTKSSSTQQPHNDHIATTQQPHNDHTHDDVTVAVANDNNLLLSKLLSVSNPGTEYVEVASNPIEQPKQQPSLLESLLKKESPKLDSEVIPKSESNGDTLFSPLRYPERLTIFSVTSPDGIRSERSINDELELRRFIAISIDSLTDEQLKVKIALYQKLGVFIRVCESEVTKIGQKRNKKFLEHDEEKSFLNLSSTNAQEGKTKSAIPRVSNEEKYIKKMMAMGLTREKAKGIWDLKEGKASSEASKLNSLA